MFWGNGQSGIKTSGVVTGFGENVLCTDVKMGWVTSLLASRGREPPPPPRHHSSLTMKEPRSKVYAAICEHNLWIYSSKEVKEWEEPGNPAALYIQKWISLSPEADFIFGMFRRTLVWVLGWPSCPWIWPQWNRVDATALALLHLIKPSSESLPVRSVLPVSHLWLNFYNITIVIFSASLKVH